METQNATEPNAVDILMSDVKSAESGKPSGDNIYGVSAGPQDEILKARIIETLCTIYDPEIPVDIYELGLIYKLDVAPGGIVKVEMTLTSPACPVAGTLPPEVETKIAAVSGVQDVTLDLVWEPPYSMDMMSEAARLQLGLW